MSSFGSRLLKLAGLSTGTVPARWVPTDASTRSAEPSRQQHLSAGRVMWGNIRRQLTFANQLHLTRPHGVVALERDGVADMAAKEQHRLRLREPVSRRRHRADGVQQTSDQIRRRLRHRGYARVMETTVGQLIDDGLRVRIVAVAVQELVESRVDDGIRPIFVIFRTLAASSPSRGTRAAPRRGPSYRGPAQGQVRQGNSPRSRRGTSWSTRRRLPAAAT